VVFDGLVGKREYFRRDCEAQPLRGLILINSRLHLALSSACRPGLKLPLHLLDNLIDAEARGPLT
jgi:hypothetical protein